MEWGFIVVGAYLIAAPFALLRSPRAALWLFLGGTSFLVSHLYWMGGAPHPLMVGSMIDCAVVLALYFNWRERWEFWIMVIFQTMLGLNLFRALSEIPARGVAILPFSISQPTAALAFELLNWLVIAIAGGAALLQQTGQANGGGLYHRWLVHGFKRAALSRRVDPPFTSRAAR